MNKKYKIKNLAKTYLFSIVSDIQIKKWHWCANEKIGLYCYSNNNCYGCITGASTSNRFAFGIINYNNNEFEILTVPYYIIMQIKYIFTDLKDINNPNEIIFSCQNENSNRFTSYTIFHVKGLKANTNLLQKEFDKKQLDDFIKNGADENMIKKFNRKLNARILA